MRSLLKSGELGWSDGKRMTRCWLEKKEKRTPKVGQGVHGASLGGLSGLVVWSVVSPLMESFFALVSEWIPSKDMIKLYELSSTVSSVLKEWFDDQILVSFGDQAWTDIRKEWTDSVCGTAKRKRRKEKLVEWPRSVVRTGQVRCK